MPLGAGFRLATVLGSLACASSFRLREGQPLNLRPMRPHTLRCVKGLTSRLACNENKANKKKEGRRKSTTKKKVNPGKSIASPDVHVAAPPQGRSEVGMWRRV